MFLQLKVPTISMARSAPTLNFKLSELEPIAMLDVDVCRGLWLSDHTPTSRNTFLDFARSSDMVSMDMCVNYRKKLYQFFSGSSL